MTARDVRDALHQACWIGLATEHEAEFRINAYRAEVLREAADIAEQVISRRHAGDCEGCSAAESISSELRRMADAVLAVVQPELDRLRAELHRHATCVQCGHERHRHGYEPIIRRDWCADCPTTNDLHTFQTKEAS